MDAIGIQVIVAELIFRLRDKPTHNQCETGAIVAFADEMGKFT